MNGTVKWFDATKGYGFLKGDDGKEYFVHHSALPMGAKLNDDQPVSFDADVGERGPIAKNVQLGAGGAKVVEMNADSDDDEEFDQAA